MITAACIRSTRLFAATLALALTLSGCAGGGGAPTRYYIIGPIEADALSPGDAPPAVQIIGLDLPQYLERVQIATQAAPNRMRFSEGHQWSENLRKNLLRTLSRNLSRLLGSPSIGAPGARSASAPDYRVRVTVTQFERDVAGTVRLDASWQILDAGGAQAVRSFQSQLSSASTVKAGDYDAIVASMQSLFGELSVAIARQVVTLDDGT